MSDFKGVGHIYMRPGQWLAVKTAEGGGASLTVSAASDGTLSVSASDKYGAVRTTVRFGPDGKVIPDGEE